MMRVHANKTNFLASLSMDDFVIATLFTLNCPNHDRKKGYLIDLLTTDVTAKFSRGLENSFPACHLRDPPRRNRSVLHFANILLTSLAEFGPFKGI